MKLSRSRKLLAENARWIPGGLASINRKADPGIAFKRGQGSRLWDVDGNEYIDYHAAFSPHILGHNDPDVIRAVAKAMREGQSLYGAGPTREEGKLARLFLQCVRYADKVQFVNTGSEATAQAIRVARAWTGRPHVLLMQGGYNGQHNIVAANLMTPKEDLGGKQVKGDEYPLAPFSAGIPEAELKLMHAVEFNDLAAVEKVAKKYPLAALITEPVLQNIGIIKPRPGYLRGLRRLANKYGFLLIFDEVKTGFRASLGGYQALAQVKPDLSTFGKALANGFPIGALAGQKKYMDLAISDDPVKRVLIAGTYNCHPVTVAAASACLKKLSDPQKKVYVKLERLAKKLAAGQKKLFRKYRIPAIICRQGSAHCVYFARREPTNWWEILEYHDFEFDRAYRRALIERGIYHFPVACKQGSISYAHSERDIDITLKQTAAVLKELTG